MSNAPESAVMTAFPANSDFLPLPKSKPRTLYASFGQRQAKITLGVYLAVVLFLVALALSPYRNNAMERETPIEYSDVTLYMDMANHVHNGMNYYEAARLEQTKNGYPTSSPFNWRTPLPMWLVAQLPDVQMGRWLLAPFAILLAVLLMSIVSQEEEGGCVLAVLSTLLVLTAVSQTFAESIFILPVNWGAVFIGLSLCCYAWHRDRLAIVLGIVAAIFRELALGYSLTMAVYALYRRQWKEFAGWCIGFCVYAVWFSWHIWMIRQTMGDSVAKQTTSWLSLGGPIFLLATAQMNVFLLIIPQWVTAICLATSWLGLIGWKTPFGRRVLVVVGAYQFVFLFIGQSFNQYWGILISPLLAVGFAWGLLSLKELLSVSLRSKASAQVPLTV